VNDRELRRQTYLAKAKEAEVQAARAQLVSQRDAWLKIAVNYRELARTT
jgi:hypothetical protein